MLRIGYFSRISQVPVKTLRYYDEIGLLQPAQVDRFTNYRYYTFDQLPRLNYILALKELGLSLERIRKMLDEELTGEEVQGMLRLQQAALAEQLSEVQSKLVRVETRLKQLTQEGKMPNHEVVLKHVDPVRVACRRVEIPAEAESVGLVGRAFGEVYSYLDAQSAKTAGPGLTLWHTPAFAQDGEEAEVAVPVEQGVAEHGQIQCRTLPEAEVAAVVHHGLFDAEFGAAYQTVLRWIDENGYHIIGPFREIYLHYAEDDAEESTTEIQFPVEKA